MSDKHNSIDQFFDNSIHIPSRTIFVGGEVDQEMAEYFLKAMHLLRWTTPGSITVIADNIGGDEYHGLGMYDAIACCPFPVEVRMYGNAMSMGSWIPQAADLRVMSPHCTMMLHYGTWGGAEMDGAHVASHAREAERLTHMMEQTYLRRIREKNPRFSLRRLRSMLRKELYLTAPEALTLGLIDRILEEW